MKKYLFILFMLTSCQQRHERDKVSAEKHTYSSVIEKITDIQTDSELEFGTSGKLYPVAKTFNVYYIVTKDKELHRVELKEFVKFSVGDSVSIDRYGNLNLIK